MDEPAKSELHKTDAELASGQRHISSQRARIARLEQNGSDAALAKELLKTFLQIQQLPTAAATDPPGPHWTDRAPKARSSSRELEPLGKPALPRRKQVPLFFATPMAPFGSGSDRAAEAEISVIKA